MSVSEEILNIFPKELIGGYQPFQRSSTGSLTVITVNLHRGG